MAMIRGEAVDRPAVNFYEVGGFMVDPADPDPYNVYNAPDWQPLLQLAEERTDLIRMMSPVRARSIDPSGSTASEDWHAFFAEKRSEENDCRIVRTVANVVGRTLTQTTKRERELDTVWTVEHLLKSNDDVDVYLQIPDEAFAEKVDVTPLLAEEERLGDRGIVMVDTEDPICSVASLFDMEEFTIFAMMEGDRMHRLLERAAKRILERTKEVSRLFPGRLWRIYGPEYASAPYLPPHLFEEYVVRYTGPMVKAIQEHGGFARVHSHGRLRGILPHIIGMGADALDPIEPPPHGDMRLEEVRTACGDNVVLFGNIEITDLENLPPDKFDEKVRIALEEGCGGRGLVVMPSASPYGRIISDRTMRNYRSMVDIIEAACDR